MWTTPEWQFEYNIRDMYCPATGLSDSQPLDAVFWDKVATAMLINQTLIETYNLFETKSSVVIKNCSSNACAQQKVCYIRSGSAALGIVGRFRGEGVRFVFVRIHYFSDLSPAVMAVG